MASGQEHLNQGHPNHGHLDGGRLPRRRLSGGRTTSTVAGWALVVAALLTGCGSGPSTASAHRKPPNRSTTPTPTTGPAAATSTRALPAGHQAFSKLPTNVGRLVVTTLSGPRSGVTLRVWVWLPPQYDQPAFARTAFPALMLYPGGSGAGYNTWAGRQYGAREAVAEGAARGTLTPFVFVMPEMQLSEKLDTECADLPGQPRVGTFLDTDVRAMVEDNFRVIRDRTGWAAAGASSGAYCASRLVFNHPDQYAAVVSISGYFTIETALRGAGSATVQAQDPAAIAVARPPQVDVLLWSGSCPGPDLQDARKFLAQVRPPTRVEIRSLPGGRHLTTDFAKMMPDSLTWLTGHLARPTPIP
jgi:enterochelin esterase-like enzyme